MNLQKRRNLWYYLIPILLITAFIGSCKKDKYIEDIGLCPQVQLTNPLNGATGVPLSQIITVTFNEKMNPATIIPSCFVLQAATPVAGTLTYDDNSATFSFVPNSPLTANTTYTGIVKTNVRDPRGNALQKEYVWSFSTGLIIAPIVSSTDPANNEVNVPLNKAISATFSLPMDPTSIKDSSFFLKNGTISVPGVVTYTDTTAVFTPTNDLLPNTLYTATITTMAKTLNKQTNLANNHVWTFTTVSAVLPFVTRTDPTNGATGVALNKVIKAIFSVPMDPLTIKDSTFTITDGSNLISGIITYSDTTATFTPLVPLTANMLYTATIKTGAKNMAGNGLSSNYNWSFTTSSLLAPTVILTDPTNGATNVVLNKNLTADFSTAMDPSTIGATTFLLKQGVNPVGGLVTYSGNTATFNPSVNLLPNTLYTATITTGAKDLSGTPLNTDYTWTFTTSSLVAPTVILTDPTNGATNVLLNKNLTADFSTAMDPSTIGATTFLLKQGVNPIGGLVTYSGVTATFNPSVDLLPNTLYTATITTGAKDLAGTAIANNYTWSFTTIAPVAPTVTSTDPMNLATNVLLNKVLTANFSEAMDPLTITNSTFTLKLGIVPVAGTVNYSGTAATFTPSSNLLSGNTYTATITTGAKNLAGVPIATNYVWTFTTRAPAGPIAPDLKSVARFGIIAGVGVSNNAGFSVINNMDVGISPGARTGVTGFPPAVIVGGAIYASDDVAPPGTPAMLVQAKQDLTDAYLFAAAAVSPAPVTVSGNIGGTTLAPGIYKSTSTLSISGGNLTLDAQGDVNAVWIFQISSALTTVGGAGGSVILTGGAQAKNIYWQSGSSVTIGDNTSFKGNLLVLTSITLNSNATVQGRVLCRNGAVVLTSTNIINKP